MILTGCAAAESAMKERNRVLNITAGDFCKRAARRQAWLLALCLTPAAHAEAVRACALVTPQKKGQDYTARIQSALNLCSPGKAVVLRGGSFESGPLILPRGVTLFLDAGTTLYASKDPRVYDLKPGSCGAAPDAQPPNCKPFLYSYQAAYSGVKGTGVIDGQVDSWKTGAGSAPELVSSYESTGFTIAGVTLRNAAGIHAAIYKTNGFSMADVRIESPESSASGPGLVLSNALDASVSGVWIRVPSRAIVLKASILGPTSGVKLSDIHIFRGRGISIGDKVYGPVRSVSFDGVSIEDAGAGFRFEPNDLASAAPKNIRYANICLNKVKQPVGVDGGGMPPADLRPREIKTDCSIAPYSATSKTKFTVDLSTLAHPGRQPKLIVEPGGSIQKAVDELPVTGGDILVKPGTYREVVTIRKPHVHLHGESADATTTVIVFNNTASNSGGTFNTSTVFVEADDVTIEQMSLVNDAGSGKGQAVALHVIGDRAVFRNLRISGAQDTLFAASRYCYGDYGPCVTARQYFADCFIEGNTDFIFGDSKAVFERCELHGVPTGQVMYTAQSRHTADQDSGYVFDHCRLTGEARKGNISLGRSWRPYATVVFLHAQIDAPVIAEGWTEWLRFGVPTLPTAYYAEFESTGPGANPKGREKYSHQLTEEEARKWSAGEFLGGWTPK
jgi:pectin methylesterase-like acyl-CoA thioesterase